MSSFLHMAYMVFMKDKVLGFSNEIHCEGYHLSPLKLNHIHFISGFNLHSKQRCFVVNPRFFMKMQNSPSYLFGA